MNHVERFNALMNFEPVDRLPRIEWAAYWDKTVARWQGEGLDPMGTDAQVIRESLGLDPYTQFWLTPQGNDTPTPTHHGSGILTTEAEYEAILPTLYQPKDFSAEHFQSVREENAAGERVVWLTLHGCFWHPRTLFGIEKHLFAFYDEPELMHRMNRDLTEYNLQLIDRFCDQVCTPQFMTIAEDMSYN
ncbi:MAG: uroporphyrinogen decarboxylase/cobalamine-independent methonine synthase family protein, partial [Planctomycetota bacterium]